jgi:hypothetical protein
MGVVIVIEICAKYPGGPTRNRGTDIIQYDTTHATKIKSCAINTRYYTYAVC